MNALIYMIPEQLSPEEMEKDWRIMLMVSIIELIQERQTGFVPFIVPHKQEPADRLLVQQLSDLIEADKEELP